LRALEGALSGALHRRFRAAPEIRLERDQEVLADLHDDLNLRILMIRYNHEPVGTSTARRVSGRSGAKRALFVLAGPPGSSPSRVLASSMRWFRPTRA